MITALLILATCVAFAAPWVAVEALVRLRVRRAYRHRLLGRLHLLGAPKTKITTIRLTPEQRRGLEVRPLRFHGSAPAGEPHVRASWRCHRAACPCNR